MSSQPLPPAVLVTRSQIVTRHAKEVHAEISAVIRAINEKLIGSKSLPIIHICPADSRVANEVLRLLKEAGYIVKMNDNTGHNTDESEMVIG